MTELHTILVPTDFSACSEQALSRALGLARHHRAALHLLHVVEISALSLPYLKVDFFREEMGRAEEKMCELLARHATDGVEIDLAVRRGAPTGAAGPVILQYADEAGADLIALGFHGRRGFQTLFMGSVAQEVIHGTDRPVLAVRECEGAPLARSVERILVPIDLSPHSERGFTHGVALARTYGAELLLIHVTDVSHFIGVYGEIDPFTPDVQERVDRWVKQEMGRMRREAEGAGVKAQSFLLSGYPSSTILDFIAERAVDLVVMTSHGRTGLDRFLLGSVSEKVLRRATCPVLLIKSFGRTFAAKPAARQAVTAQ
jgi:nucleotide-binding universal stress UspA family protein